MTNGVVSFVEAVPSPLVYPSMADRIFGMDCQTIGSLLLYLAALLTLWSMGYYLMLASPMLRKRHKQN